MSISSLNVSAGYEILPGYFLQRKIGSGGYGEVWLADAPGGLKKAVKLVFGTMSEAHATNELRALRRILSVNHPFLLSLERIEIVEGQLIVVTELADGSLLDRFNQCRSKGEVGIARDRLLQYMRDAAEALDFLCQRHDLQHLDIKPGNLLLLADRVKVADFGLVKDIHNHSLSMVSGLTPTYASPELFDGRPGRYSDQYSLAVVYHELLTGHLPFSGRTAAQIASEHLHKAPNLEALAPFDRPIVQKALSKKPTQRYASCVEFIDSLIQAAKNIDASEGNSDAENRYRPTWTPRPSEDGSLPERNSEATISSKTICIPASDVQSLSPLQGNPELETKPSPVLFIGLGKTGGKALIALREKLTAIGLNLEDQFQYDWLFFDTDTETTEMLIDESVAGRLSHKSCITLPIRTADEYRKVNDDRFAPISRRWLYNVPRSEKTEGIRPIGMLAFLDHAEDCMDLVHARIAEFKSRTSRQELGEKTRVYLIASPHGGTGGTLINELAFLVHEALSKNGMNATIQAVLTLAQERDNADHSLEAACALACFSEIAHYMGNGGLHPGVPSLPAFQAAARTPVDYVYVIDGGVLGSEENWQHAIDTASDYLMLDGCSGLGRQLDEERHRTVETSKSEVDCDWTPWLRTCATTTLELQLRKLPQDLAAQITHDALCDWFDQIRRDQDSNNQNTEEWLKTAEHIVVSLRKLFQEQGWTAEAWTENLLMTCSTPQYQAPDTASLCEGRTVHTAPIDAILREIAPPVGLRLEDVSQRVEALFARTVEALRKWLQKECGASSERWSHLSFALSQLSRNFSMQAQQLRRITEKLRERCAKLNIEENNGEDSRATEAWIFAKVHELGACMLERLAKYSIELRHIWSLDTQVVLRCMQREIDKTKLLDGNRKTNRFDSEQAILSQSVRNTVSPQVNEFLADKLLSHLFSLWNWDADECPASNSAAAAALKPIRRLSVDKVMNHSLELVQQMVSNNGWDSRPITKESNCPALLQQIRSTHPTLLRTGGAKRDILAVPSDLAHPSVHPLWKQMTSDFISIVGANGMKNPIFLSDGERIDIAQVANLTCLPNDETSHLAKRLLARNDVECKLL